MPSFLSSLFGLGIQASFRIGLVLPRVVASTERQISSTVLKRASESVSFSFAPYINGKCHSQAITIFLRLLENELE
jgi:translation initiation factor IF-2